MPPAAVISCFVAARSRRNQSRSVPCIMPFFVDVGAQEAGAERLQLPDHFFGGKFGRFLPALHHDLAALRIERDDQPLRPNRIRDLSAALPVETPPSRQSRDARLARSTCAPARPIALRRPPGTWPATQPTPPARRSIPCPWPHPDRSPESPETRANRSSISSGAPPSSALSRPCTSCTTLPSIRSMQGMITAPASPRRRARREMSSDHPPCTSRSERSTPPAPHRLRPRRAPARNLPASPPRPTRSPECASRRDTALRQRAIEAGLHAVGVHRREQDLARAQRFALPRPFDGVDPFVVAAAAREDIPASRRHSGARRSPAPPPARRTPRSIP